MAIIYYANQDVKGSITTGGTISSGGVVSAPGGNSTQWNTSYDNMITGLAVTGTTTKTLTATQQDGGTITASWADDSGSNNYLTGLTFNTGNGILTATRQGLSSVTVDLDGRYVTSSGVTSVATGSGLTGGTITGSGTVSVDYGTSGLIADAPAGSGTPDVDDLVLIGQDSSSGGETRSFSLSDLPFTNNTGDITSVTAGDGLSGGGISGGVTVSVDYLGSDNIILDAPSEATGTLSTSDRIMVSSASTGNVYKSSISNLPFTNNAGDITNVSTTSPITGGGSSGSVTIAHANSGATAGSYTNANVTVNATGHVTSVSSGSDAQGVTSVATGNGISGGTITSTGTLTVGAGDGLSQSSTGLLVDSTVVRTSGTQSIGGAKTFSDDVKISGTTKDLIIENDAETQAGIVFIDAQATTTQAAAIKFDCSTETLDFFMNDESAERMSINTAGALIISGGNIELGGTGRIQGVDTVSSGTDAANKTYVDNAVAGVPQGDITNVSTTSPITGGGSSGSVTIAHANSGATAGSYTNANVTVNATGHVTSVSSGSDAQGVTSVATSGTVSGLTLTGGTITSTGTITLGGTLSLTSSNVTSALGFTPYNATNPAGYTANTGTTTASNTQTFTNKSGNISQWTNNSGYITSASLPTVNNPTITITTATGLDGATSFTLNQSSAQTIALSLDLSELTDMTAAMTGTDEFIVLDSGAERRKAANEIGLSIFSNDAGFITSSSIPSVGNGTLTVQGTGVLGGSGTFTANQSGNSTISVTHDNSGATAGSYTNANITINASGHVTAAANGSDANTNYYTTTASFNTGNGIISFSGANGQPAYSVDIDGRFLPFTGGVMSGKIGRSSAIVGFLEGSYNNVGANGVNSNPIYTIGSNYNPASTTLGNMYGVGYASASASFIDFTGQTDWGFYVAADGDARVWLDGTSGNIVSKGVVYSTGGNSNEWNTSYDNMITAFSDSGSSTITLTLTQQDGGTLTTSFSNPQGTTTPSNTQTFTNKSGNISQWTNDSGYITSSSIPSVGNGTFTVTGSSGLSGSGSMTANQSGNSSATLTNSDKGSSQNIFKNIAVSGQSTVVADSNNDTLTLVAAGGMTITTDATSDTITFNPNDDNSNYYTTTATFNTGNGIISFSGAGGQPAYSVDIDGKFVNKAGDAMSGTLDMANNQITNVGNISINDPGANEGISWNGGNLWKIYESPNTQTNASGNLQFVQNATRRLTIDTSGNVEIVSGDLTVGGRDLIFSNTGTNDANVTSSLGINFIVGSSLSGLEIDVFGGVTTYSVLTTGGNIIVEGGGIQLNGTGRIQGVDTVSASTDAANKAYVDAATSGAMTGFGVSNLPSGTGTTFTISNGQTVGIVGGTNIQSVVNTTNETITLNYTGGTGSGSVTSVTAGTGMTQTGTSTINPTLNVIGGTGITANANDIAVDYAGADSIIMAAPDGGSPDGDDYLLFGADSSGGGESVKVQFVDLPLSIMDNDAGFTSNTGDITAVTPNFPITGGGTSGSVSLSLKVPVSGDWHNGGAIVVGTDGLSEIGRYLDFHTTDTSTSDYDVRLQADTNGKLHSSATIRSEGNLEAVGNMVAGYLNTTNGSASVPSHSFTGDTNTGMYRASADRIGFTTGGAQRAYISNTTFYVAGNLGVGTASPSTKLHVDGVGLIRDSSGVGDFYLGNYVMGNHFRFHTNNSNTYFDMNCGNIYWRQGISTRYTFFPSTANMTVNGTITQNSDSRVKENVIEIGDCISKVQAMRGVYYNRTDFNTEVTKVGVIAQEVEEVLPELIIESPEDGLKSVAYSELTAVLINAIKEQQEIIEDLKTRIIKLEK